MELFASQISLKRFVVLPNAYVIFAVGMILAVMFCAPDENTTELLPATAIDTLELAVTTTLLVPLEIEFAK